MTTTEDKNAAELKRARFSRKQPVWSRWLDGWLISMTTMDGWEMVQYPGEKPFVLSREDYLALPQHHYFGDE